MIERLAFCMLAAVVPFVACGSGSDQDPNGAECPGSAPSDGVACVLQTPDTGDLSCVYGGCGRVDAACDGAAWNVDTTPGSMSCVSLCRDVCLRLSEF